MSNHITVVGNIGQELELRYTQSGMAICSFSIGDTYGKDDKKKTTWHNVTAFSKLAENLCASASKGDSVIISGRYEQEEYTKKDGTKGKGIKIIADEIGMSIRWNAWVKDRTEDTVAMIGNRFGSKPMFEDDSF